MSTLLTEMKKSIERSRLTGDSVAEAFCLIIENYDHIKDMKPDTLAHELGMTSTYPTEIRKFFKIVKHVKRTRECMIIG